MTDLSNCVKDKDGGLWFFDKDTRTVCKVIIEQREPKLIPNEVLLDLLVAESKRK
jgi:hypothetical protein